MEISDTSDSQGEVRAHEGEEDLGEARTYPKTRTPLMLGAVGLMTGDLCTDNNNLRKFSHGTGHALGESGTGTQSTCSPKGSVAF